MPTTQSMHDVENKTYLFRRCAAGLYDSFILMAITLLIGFLFVGVYQKITGSMDTTAHPQLLHWVLFPLVVLVCFMFYAWCWRRGGSTLGMQAWRIRLVSQTGQPISWKQCLQRSAVACLSWACLGIGYWWAVWQRDKLTWHDWASNTRVVFVPPKQKA